MEIRQHIPNFVSGYEPETIKFNDTEELKNIEFVKHWSEGDDFFKYSLSGNHLMAELNNGNTWWVIGTIKGDLNKVDLPKWMEE